MKPNIAFWKQAFKTHEAECVYCPNERKVSFVDTLDDYLLSSVDHLIPTASGGANHPDNIVPACVICNFYKKALLVPEPKFSLLTETRSDNHLYVKEGCVREYLSIMREIVQEEKTKQKIEFEKFKKFVEDN